MSVVVGCEAPSRGGNVDRLAGSGERGFKGDGGLAKDALLDGPAGVTADEAGNAFVSDGGNNRVRRIDRSGRITTLAGDGQARFSGDGAQAAKASLSSPSGLALDGAGALFVADTGNNRVRRIDSHGVITTVAGDGRAGWGPGGVATQTPLNRPVAVAAASDGVLFIADAARILRVDAHGSMTTFAGGGSQAPAVTARRATDVNLLNPRALALSSKGEVFVAVAWPDESPVPVGQVLRIDRRGLLSVVAGPVDRTSAGPAKASAIGATLAQPSGLAVAGDGLLIAQMDANQVSRLDRDGTLHPLVQVFDGDTSVPPTAAAFLESSPLESPGALAVRPGGGLLVAEPHMNQVSFLPKPAAQLRVRARALPPARQPTVDFIGPTAGGELGGTAVIVRGDGLSIETRVLFGGKEARLYGVHNSYLLAYSPPGTPGTSVDIAVFNGNVKPSLPPAARFSYTTSWERAAPLREPLLLHTATLLDPPACRGVGPVPAGYPCGGVIVIGGHDTFCVTCQPRRETEMYDPARDAWRAGPTLSEGRMEHSATLLPDGHVLVVGGKQAGVSGIGRATVSSAELVDPASGRSRETGSLSEGRFAHTATLLDGPDCAADRSPRANWCGKVLVAGGASEEDTRPAVATAELYDPQTGTWASAGSMVVARGNHTASLLADGRVMVAGGLTSPSASVASVEIYDPSSNSWSSGPSMGTARALHTATTLPDGRILVVGGMGGRVGAFLRSAEVFDPATGSWHVAGLPVEGRSAHTASLLPSGFVLVAGGGLGFEDAHTHTDSIASAEVYDPATNGWSAVRPLNTARSTHTAVVLEGPACRGGSPPKYCGAVLVSGGGTTQPDPGTHLSPVVQATSELYR